MNFTSYPANFMMGSTATDAPAACVNPPEAPGPYEPEGRRVKKGR